MIEKQSIDEQGEDIDPLERDAIELELVLDDFVKKLQARNIKREAFCFYYVNLVEKIHEITKGLSTNVSSR